jgi:hypothetical protein
MLLHNFKLFFMGTLLLGFDSLHAQQAVLSSGGVASGIGGTSSFSVGQVICSYNAGTTGAANQGVQQPYEYTADVDDNNEITLEMTVYPNPTHSTITLKVENISFDNLTFQMYDLRGKLLMNDKLSSSLTQLPMQTLTAGTYVLKVLNMQSALKTFNIIKNN